VTDIATQPDPRSSTLDAPLIAASTLHKTYRLGRVDVPVLRGVSLDVRPGEWVAILGASGSGKSTLLHLMGGLDRPDRPSGGEILFQSRPLSSMRAMELDRYRARSVGFVFQFYHLLPELTVMENVSIAAMVRHGRANYQRQEVVARARELLEGFGLGHRLAHRPAELSGGERQRVAIARALINAPAVLLADEPTGNLDRTTGEKILDSIATHKRATGQTIVMVTHDALVAARADRVVRLEDGRVAPAGAP
jgi:lipoprotein-releasing system ATP-binding protein